MDLPLRQQLIDTARQMNHIGLNQGTSGNLSVRAQTGILITPSALPYDVLTPEDIVLVDWDGKAHGKRRPSSEWHFHLDILRARTDANAVLHAHPTFCIALATHGLNIPSFHYMVAVAGGEDIRCAPYATFGTQDLSHNILQALDNRKACLMAHHGMVALGKDLADVLSLAIEVESLAKQYWHAKQLGEPPLLSQEEMQVILGKFKDYKAASLNA